ncbi:MAG TPA: hypothetical protein VFU37_08410 [Pyrinomonadaceae bacterium]|nr:hypothetical protein [Pyrinomonadaceae bacterium]
MTRTAVILLLTICASIGFGTLRTNRNQPQQPVDSMSQGPLKVTITSIGPALGPPTNRYKFGERMPVMIELTNTSNQLAYACVSSDLYQDVPRLTKNGEVMPYTKRQADLLRNDETDRTCEIYDLPERMPLKSNQSRTADIMIVADDVDSPTGAEAWYDALKPGVYELSIQRRFGCCDGPMVESNKISFEVLP